MDPAGDRIEKAQLPKLRDLFGYNASRSEVEAHLALRRYEYLLEQRDKLNERIRFGILTLNAASLVALASLADNEKKLKLLGLSSNTIGLSALLFGIGLALAAIAIWSNSNHAIGLPAQAFEALMKADHKRAFMENRCGEKAEAEFRSVLAEKPKPAPDFAFSHSTIYLTNASGSVWLVGLGSILIAVVKATVSLCLCS